MRLLGEAVEQGTPVLDAVALNAQQIDVRGGAQQAVLQVLTESVVDGEGDDERGDSRGHAEDGDGGDDADEGLAALGAEVTRGYEEFEGH